MRAVVALLGLAACGSPGARPAALGGADTDGWTWTASTGGPWRLPRAGRALAITADGRAIVQVGERDVVAVELATGAVGPITEVVAAPAAIEAVVRAGDRVLAFGTRAPGAPAVWAIVATPAPA